MYEDVKVFRGTRSDDVSQRSTFNLTETGHLYVKPHGKARLKFGHGGFFRHSQYPLKSVTLAANK